MTLPAVATGRIVFPYTIDGLNHVTHLYVKNPTLVGAVWQINSRTTDANDTDWTDAAEAFFSQLANILTGGGATFGPAQLQKLESGLWQIKDTYTTATVAGAASYTKAEQLSLTVRDNTNKRFRIQVMETVEAQPLHTSSPTGFSAGMDSFVGECIGTVALANRSFEWCVSRMNQYIKAGGFVAISSYPNRKLARRRGV